MPAVVDSWQVGGWGVWLQAGGVTPHGAREVRPRGPPPLRNDQANRRCVAPRPQAAAAKKEKGLWAGMMRGLSVAGGEPKAEAAPTDAAAAEAEENAAANGDAGAAAEPMAA